jgi:hypothetical protein
VTFSEPVHGFPEGAADPGALRPSNYRFILGNLDDFREAKDFAARNPATDGQNPTKDPYYAADSANIVVLPMPNGSLSRYNQLKLYVSPDVKDIAGNPTATASEVAAMGQLQGAIQ